MKTGLKVLDAMTKQPVTVSPNATTFETASMMKKEHVGSVIVENKGKLVGILSEQDLVYKVIANNKNPKTTLVKDVMTKDVVTINPDVEITDAMLKMSKVNVRRLPVTENDNIVGMLTMKDILKIEPQLFELVVDKIELREEQSKPIYKIGEREGICELCSNYAGFLFEQDGAMVCKDCRE
jgi:CBS domain-containing protein